MRLPAPEFWELTPRQFHLLWDQRLADIRHRELLHAYTTAALVNGLYKLDKPVPESAFMPNFRHPESSVAPILTPEMDDFRARRANIAALLEIYHNTGIPNPQLIAMGLASPAQDKRLWQMMGQPALMRALPVSKT